jgi:hypothetical protein
MALRRQRYDAIGGGEIFTDEQERRLAGQRHGMAKRVIRSGVPACARLRPLPDS